LGWRRTNTRAVVSAVVLVQQPALELGKRHTLFYAIVQYLHELKDYSILYPMGCDVVVQSIDQMHKYYVL
jgi:hypothetical protein